MKKYWITLLSILVITAAAAGQNKTKPAKAGKSMNPAGQLIGTWRLIEFADLDLTTSTWTYSYGKNPKGYFTYTGNGIVNLNISAETPLIISEDSARRYNVNLEKWVNYNSVGYFGTYTVDVNRSVVTHHVKGGSMPWYIDTDQERPFILKGDTLIIGDNKTWKRVLVKEK